jgi:hypothetical protein
MNDQYLDLSETFIDLTVSLVKLDTKISMAGDVELGVINNFGIEQTFLATLFTNESN